ncbi:helix-turn-helix domain-containing protein [Streptomyces sp. NPDC002928]|uniref:helix-turn-helix domain-containing protein n=1 Tax=Streptomyces sp. NPDC002928 TaxID=3154440 RepID=UPI0033A47610
MSEKSVYQWCRAFKTGGREALRSKDPCGYGCRLGPHLQTKLAVSRDSPDRSCRRRAFRLRRALLQRAVDHWPGPRSSAPVALMNPVRTVVYSCGFVTCGM